MKRLDMSASLIRSRALVTHAIDRHRWNEITDRAVLQEDAVQVFRMTTSGGAATTPFADTIGALEVGRAADMVLIDWRAISYPYLDPETRQDEQRAHRHLRR
jgi:cytosine/adenosine deaminase-related metal-dependent hydrolase